MTITDTTPAQKAGPQNASAQTIALPDAPAPPVPRHWTGASDGSSWVTTARSMVPALAQQAERHDRAGDFVDDAIAELRSHRAMSMLVPAELGGGGASHAEACALLSELAHGCPATALTLSMHQHLVAAQVWRHHRSLPAPVLPKVAADQLVLVSTGAADWLESGGSVERVDGGYRVSGRKSPSSGCPAGNILVTSFRWDDAPDGPQVIHCTVPFSAEGVSIEPTWNTLGMRATGSHTVALVDVLVPDAAVSLARPAGAWHPVWSTVLGAALPLIMSVYVGVAEAAADTAIGRVLQRTDATRRADAAPLVGRMLNQLTVARDAVAAMLAMSDDLHFDNTLDHASAMLSRKTIAADACTAVLRLAMEAGGGSAYHAGSTLERLFRDVHGATYHPLPPAQQERFTGRVALGLPPV